MGLPKTPSVVAECVLFDPMWRVLLICRGNEPFRGDYALPAGFVEIGETVEEACCREVKEETGVEIGDQGHWRSKKFAFNGAEIIAHAEAALATQEAKRAS